MIYKYGDMFSESQDDYILITTNCIIKKDGALVMGAGAARQARDSMKGIDKFFGSLIQSHEDPENYGVILGKRFGIFQVKYHFKEEALPEIIGRSLDKLKVIAEALPHKKFSLNYPGIGNGKLGLSIVEGLLEEKNLPKNITIWRIKETDGKETEKEEDTTST